MILGASLALPEVSAISEIRDGEFMDRRILIPITLVLMYFTASINAAEKMNAIIIDHQNHDEGYWYAVPGYSKQSSNAKELSAGVRNNASNNKSGTLDTTGAYQVRGATLTLKLPDNRLVVVNCSPKLKLIPIPGSRSCLVPPINKIKVEFIGDKAKVEWPVSVDGSKSQKEIYTILAVFDEIDKADK
jgi:hypothetical protein